MKNSFLLAIFILGVASVATAEVPPTPQQIMKARVAAPTPTYPAEALARHVTGSGSYKIHFRVKTGKVRSVRVVQSTGDKTLDAAALEAFSHWKFKAGALPPIKSFAPQTTEPFADEDFVVLVPMTFQLSSGGKASVSTQLDAPR